MISTLTLNPSIDRTVLLEVLQVGEVQRVLDTTFEAAGKGVNIAKAHGTNGLPAQAILAAEPEAEAMFRRELDPLGVACQIVGRQERTRSNLSVIERDGTTTKLNEKGSALQPAVLDALMELATDAEKDGMVAAAGSLPADAAADTYAALAKRMQDPGQTLAVDTSGPALSAMVGVPCAVAKPNLEELQTLFDGPLETMGKVIEAANELRHGGWTSVLVSLGPHGALLVEASGAHHGRSAVDAVRNTVGAGDALLAGYLAGHGQGLAPQDALAEALAWANAAVTSAGTGAPAVTDTNRATVELSQTIEPQLPVGEE